MAGLPRIGTSRADEGDLKVDQCAAARCRSPLGRGKGEPIPGADLRVGQERLASVRLAEEAGDLAPGVTQRRVPNLLERER